MKKILIPIGTLLLSGLVQAQLSTAENYVYTKTYLDYNGKEADITLYDMEGRQLQSLKTKNKVTKINTQNLTQGAYLNLIKTDAEKTANAKMIKK